MNLFIHSSVFIEYLSPSWGFPRWLSGKESTCQSRKCGFNPWVGKIPWRRKWQPSPVFFLPRTSHGQRSLAAYSSWSCKESTWLSNRTATRIHITRQSYALLCVWLDPLSRMSSRFIQVVQSVRRVDLWKPEVRWGEDSFNEMACSAGGTLPVSTAGSSLAASSWVDSFLKTSSTSARGHRAGRSTIHPWQPCIIFLSPISLSCEDPRGGGGSVHFTAEKTDDPRS